MAYDGIVLHSVVKELQKLIGSKVNHIYQPNNNNVLLSVYNGSLYSINIDTSADNYRLSLTTYSKPNPMNAANFCMILRKYLIGSRISNVYMNGLERICYIEFECFNEMNDKVNRTLIIELMGKYSNIILLNENKMIIDALKKFDGNGLSRDIMPARKYVLPASSKFDFATTSLENFIQIVSNSDYKNLDSSISSMFVGISKLFIQSSLEELKISNTVTNSSLKLIYKYIHNIIDFDSSVVCQIYSNNYSIVLSSSPIDGVDSFNVNFFIDDFYENKYIKDQYIAYRNNLLKILSITLDKLVKKINNIDEKIKKCENIDKYKLYGELLTANIYKFKNNNFYDDKIQNSVELTNYYDNSLIKIPIDINFSIQKNAENYFKKYNKLKNTLNITSVQKVEAEKELEYLQSLIYELDNCSTLNDIDDIYNEISNNILFNEFGLKNKSISNHNNIKSQNASSNSSIINNYISIMIDGFDVFIGKNNKQNDYLTTKVARDNDYWLHTKDIHGSHVIIRCNGNMPKISTISKCASLAAYYSKAKFSSHVPVDYTLAKYVKKPHGSVPGYVIYTNNKTVFVNPSSTIF